MEVANQEIVVQNLMTKRPSGATRRWLLRGQYSRAHIIQRQVMLHWRSLSRMAEGWAFGQVVTEFKTSYGSYDPKSKTLD